MACSYVPAAGVVLGVGHDDPAGRVHLQRHPVTPLRRMPEDFVQHPDHVLEAVIVVVEQNNVVGW
jgi:hypothetical protein